MIGGSGDRPLRLILRKKLQKSSDEKFLSEVFSEVVFPVLVSDQRYAEPSKKSNMPHQSAPMDRKSKSWVDVSERHCLHGPLARNEINKSFEVAGEVPKGPGNQGKVGAVRPKFLRKG